MNSYNKYTDLQINELVATRLKKKCLLTEESVLAYMDSGYRTFDPCNNPTDAMPIIIENNISITLSDDKDEGKWMAFDGDWYDEHSLSRTSVSYGDNYYRIAMICFLLMKDAENES